VRVGSQRFSPESQRAIFATEAMDVIPPELIDRIREATDIVEVISRYVSLKSTGKGFKGLCPFHQEKTPSFTVNPDRQFFHCFGCKAGGNVFHFVMRAESLDFVEAVKELAQRAGIPLPESGSPANAAQETQRRQLLEVTAWAAGRFQEALRRPGISEPAKAYLRRRGISDELAEAFALGYAPDGWDNLLKAANRDHYSEGILEKAGLIVPRKEGGGFYDRFRQRLMFPIRDLQGRAVAFGGRVLDAGEPKYLNSPETPLFKKGELLYGLDLAREAARRRNRLVLVEGYMDVMTCHAFGFTEAVASLGTALTPAQANLIRRFTEKVLLTYDADEAGVQASLRAFEVLNREGLLVQVVSVPGAKDPDEFLRARGAEAFQKLLDEPLTMVEFVFGHLAAKENLERLEGKVAVLKALSPVVAQMASPVERSLSVTWIAGRLALDERTVVQELGRQKRPPLAAAAAEAREAAPADTEAPALPEEQELLSALLKHPALVGKFRERLRPDFFSRALHRRLAEALLAAEPATADNEETWTQAWVNALAEPALTEAALTFWSESSEGGSSETVARDCLNRLEGDWLRRRIKAVQTQLGEAQAKGEREAFKELAQAEIELKNHLKKMGVDWGGRTARRRGKNGETA
jgi:DNA primase